jgi:hypothetical protein
MTKANALEGGEEEPVRSERDEMLLEEAGHLAYAASFVRALAREEPELRRLLGPAAERMSKRAETFLADSGVYGASLASTGIDTEDPLAGEEARRAAARSERISPDFSATLAAPRADPGEPDVRYFHGRDSQLAGGGAARIDRPADFASSNSRFHVPNKFGPGTGRRLFEQSWAPRGLELRSNWVSHRLMAAGPIRGLDQNECAALCEALRRNSSESSGREECRAFAFRRARPESPSDFELERCELLSDTGSCSPIDFASRMWTGRRYPLDVSDCDFPVDPRTHVLCIELSAARSDTRVLDAAAAEEICEAGMSGRGKLPFPRSKLEAMQYVAYARQQARAEFRPDRVWHPLPPPRPPVPFSLRECTRSSPIDRLARRKAPTCTSFRKPGRASCTSPRSRDACSWRLVRESPGACSRSWCLAKSASPTER